MTIKRRGSASRKHADRLAWLRAGLDRYADVPGIRDDVTAANRAGLDRLVTAMDAQGLFAASRGTESKRQQHRDTVRRLLSELRGEHVVWAW